MDPSLEKRLKRQIIGKPHRFLAVVPLGFEQTLVNELNCIWRDERRSSANPTGSLTSSPTGYQPETQSVEGSSAVQSAKLPHVTGDGKVEFTAKITEAWKVVAYSRIANRVLMHIADFKAENFREFEKKASEIPFELFLDERTGYALQTRDERYFGKVITQAHNSIGSVMPACKQPVAKLASHVILEPKAIGTTPHQQQSLSIHVTCKHSRLYHSDAIAERLQKIICKTSSSLDPSTPALQASAQDDKIAKPQSPFSQHLYVTLIDDRCTIWIDLAGEELYKRGHERFVNDAPLKETIAAAMLFEASHLNSKQFISLDSSPFDRLRDQTRLVSLSNHTQDDTNENLQNDRRAIPQSELSERPHTSLHTTLIDPMAGSGTFSLEAADIANKLIPGLCRDFALKHQPAFKETTWNYILRRETRDEGRENSNSAIAQNAKSKNLNIVTSDISKRAIEIIKHNVECSPLANIEPKPIQPKLKDFFSYTAKEITEVCGDTSPVIVLNPPYGKRLDFDAPKLYTKIGRYLAALALDLKPFGKSLTVAILAPKDDSRPGNPYTCTTNLLHECPALSPEHNANAKHIVTSHGGLTLNVFIAKI